MRKIFEICLWIEIVVLDSVFRYLYNLSRKLSNNVSNWFPSKMHFLNTELILKPVNWQFMQSDTLIFSVSYFTDCTYLDMLLYQKTWLTLRPDYLIFWAIWFCMDDNICNLKSRQFLSWLMDVLFLSHLVKNGYNKKQIYLDISYFTLNVIGGWLEIGPNYHITVMFDPNNMGQ